MGWSACIRRLAAFPGVTLELRRDSPAALGQCIPVLHSRSGQGVHRLSAVTSALPAHSALGVADQALGFQEASDCHGEVTPRVPIIRGYQVVKGHQLCGVIYVNKQLSGDFVTTCSVSFHSVLVIAVASAQHNTTQHAREQATAKEAPGWT